MGYLIEGVQNPGPMTPEGKTFEKVVIASVTLASAVLIFFPANFLIPCSFPHPAAAIYLEEGKRKEGKRRRKEHGRRNLHTSFLTHAVLTHTPLTCAAPLCTLPNPHNISHASFPIYSA